MSLRMERRLHRSISQLLASTGTWNVADFTDIRKVLWGALLKTIASQLGYQTLGTFCDNKADCQGAITVLLKSLTLRRSTLNSPTLPWQLPSSPPLLQITWASRGAHRTQPWMTKLVMSPLAEHQLLQSAKGVLPWQIGVASMILCLRIQSTMRVWAFRIPSPSFRWSMDRC